MCLQLLDNQQGPVCSVVLRALAAVSVSSIRISSATFPNSPFSIYRVWSPFTTTSQCGVVPGVRFTGTVAGGLSWAVCAPAGNNFPIFFIRDGLQFTGAISPPPPPPPPVRPA